MTLIAFATNERSADLLTDTSSYTQTLTAMGQSTKVTPITHLNTALLTQGECSFGYSITAMVQALADQAPDLDSLVNDLPEQARAVWSSIVSDGREVDSTCFLVGYSPRTRRFTAYGFASEHDFEPWEISGLHVMPSPFTMRPSDLELGRMEADGAVHAQSLQALRAKPTPVPPSGVAQWIALGRLAREHRFGAGVKTGLKTAVAGQLLHTHLSRGKVSAKSVYRFDDAGPEFQRMVEGTYHPQAQLGPCPCGSGQRYLECHLAKHASEPCLCKSGQTFGDCCRVEVALEPDLTTTKGR